MNHQDTKTPSGKNILLGILVFLAPWCLDGGIVFSPSPVQAEQWMFLPSAPLFQSFIGDPREPYTGITAYGNQSRFEGAVGQTFEFLRYSPPDKTRWGWGVFGQGYILLDENGATFPMRAGDWYAGMYVSETSGDLSHRLEFEHQSAHLGDSLQGLREPFFFSRENFNYTFSCRPGDSCGFYAGLGAWENMYPKGRALFASLGTEIYSPAADVGGTFFRGYAAGDLKWLQETEVVDQAYQLGIQWKFKKEESRDVRLALLYYNGDSEFGQFYRDHDEHWGFGLYFDP
jgi:hypothetical protein